MTSILKYRVTRTKEGSKALKTLEDSVKERSTLDLSGKIVSQKEEMKK